MKPLPNSYAALRHEYELKHRRLVRDLRGRQLAARARRRPYDREIDA